MGVTGVTKLPIVTPRYSRLRENPKEGALNISRINRPEDSKEMICREIMRILSIYIREGGPRAKFGHRFRENRLMTPKGPIGFGS